MIDRSLIRLDKLLDLMLDDMHGNTNKWWHLVEIIPKYMPPYQRPDTLPICVVRFAIPINPEERSVFDKDKTHHELFLRHSAGPRQGYWWDAYGDDMQSPELALLALLKAPVPPTATKKEIWNAPEQTPSPEPASIDAQRASPKSVAAAAVEAEVKQGKWEYASDWHEHEAHAATVRAAAEAFLLEHYGSRCKDFEIDCPCCQKWEQLDILLDNPHDERASVSESEKKENRPVVDDTVTPHLGTMD